MLTANAIYRASKRNQKIKDSLMVNTTQQRLTCVNLPQPATKKASREIAAKKRKKDKTKKSITAGPVPLHFEYFAPLCGDLSFPGIILWDIIENLYTNVNSSSA